MHMSIKSSAFELQQRLLEIGYEEAKLEKVIEDRQLIVFTLKHKDGQEHICHLALRDSTKLSSINALFVFGESKTTTAACPNMEALARALWAADPYTPSDTPDFRSFTGLS